MTNKRIGIMGGTFDPIHNGHLLAANEAYRALGLSEVLFVPTGQPPHKNSSRVTSAKERYEMTLLATNDVPYFNVSRIEIEREGATRSVDTLKELKQMPEYADAAFFFITGVDAIGSVESWKAPEELATLCHFVVTNRYGYSFEQLKKLPQYIQDAITTLEMPYIDISSTEVRTRIRNGEGARFLLPAPVERFIEKHGLYQN